MLGLGNVTGNGGRLFIRSTQYASILSELPEGTESKTKIEHTHCALVYSRNHEICALPMQRFIFSKSTHLKSVSAPNSQ
jgi:hypothetical protein